MLQTDRFAKAGFQEKEIFQKILHPQTSNYRDQLIFLFLVQLSFCHLFYFIKIVNEASVFVYFIYLYLGFPDHHRMLFQWKINSSMCNPLSMFEEMTQTHIHLIGVCSVCMCYYFIDVTTIKMYRNFQIQIILKQICFSHT